MKIYCVGDSITWGATLEEDISRRWTDLVVAETEHEVINCGLNGDTTTGMLMRCHTQLFPQKPDLILFLGGTNDICHTWEYRQACANIVSVVLNAREQGIPVMVGIPLPIVARRLLPRPWAPDRDADFIAGQFEAYARWLEVWCRERDVPAVDFHRPFLREDGSVREELFSDALHPNAAGHRLMADVLCRALEDLMR